MMPLTIFPYRRSGVWVFDDARTGLKEEAFVAGADTMIDAIIAAKGIPNASTGLSLTFSDSPFPGYDAELRWLRTDPVDGNWYSSTIAGRYIEGWLCPALFLYFEAAPQRIFVQAEPLPAGVKPIWEPPPGAETRRFIGPEEFPDSSGRSSPKDKGLPGR